MKIFFETLIFEETRHRKIEINVTGSISLRISRSSHCSKLVRQLAGLIGGLIVPRFLLVSPWQKQVRCWWEWRNVILRYRYLVGEADENTPRLFLNRLARSYRSQIYPGWSKKRYKIRRVMIIHNHDVIINSPMLFN